MRVKSDFMSPFRLYSNSDRLAVLKGYNRVTAVAFAAAFAVVFAVAFDVLFTVAIAVVFAVLFAVAFAVASL